MKKNITTGEAHLILDEWNRSCQRFLLKGDLYNYLAQKFKRSPEVIHNIVQVPGAYGIIKRRIKEFSKGTEIDKKRIKRCRFDIGFNAFGMPIFFCLTHGNPNSKYQRIKEKCCQKLIRKLKILIS